MPKVIPLRPGVCLPAVAPTSPLLDQEDIEFVKLTSHCLKIMFGFMNGARSAFEHAEKESRISLSHMPGLIATLDHMMENINNPTRKGDHYGKE